MKRMPVIAAAAALFLSCAPRSAAAPRAETPAGSPAAKEASAAESAGTAAAGMESLGLTVFDEPKPVPDFSLASVDGKKISISDLKGKYVFLNFWATWCPPCREEMPSMEKLYDKYRDSDFTVLAVSVREDPKTVRAFLEKTPYGFPIVLDPDGAVSSIFVGRGIPTTYILDREGRAIAGMVGGRKWDDDASFAVFEDLLTK